MPGGVNSPVRAFGSVGGTPRFLEHGKGARVFDADGNAYLDYLGSWGPLILGHAHPGVLRAVRAAMARGTSFGASTELEIELAELVCRAVPGVEVFAELALQAPYNDLEAVEDLFGRHGGEIACLIVEPVAGNMGCIPPAPGFLEGLRALCDRSGALLVFDEVITGFRVAYGGAQQRYGVTPDLTCLGKVIGGGFPAAAFGGRRDLMQQMAPEGPVYQAGTLSGNPLAMAAGAATLRELERPGVYERLEGTARRLAEGLSERGHQAGVELTTCAVGGMFGFFFHPGPVRSYTDAQKSNAERFRRFHRSMLNDGIYLAPSPFESAFVSLAHRPADVAVTLDAAERGLRRAAGVR
jgi:glutamate-1-semialdehyde 2,1-aminomutase